MTLWSGRSGGEFEFRDVSPANSDKADLSSNIWKRDMGCAGGCTCGCCHRKDAGPAPYPDLIIPKWPIDSSVNQIPKWPLNPRGANWPILWPELQASDSSKVPYDDRTTELDRYKLTVSNGDQLTLGGMNRFDLVSKDGKPITIIKTIDSQADDAPVDHVLSNGAIYRSRGGWNHNESITWPNGDVVNFTDGGQFKSYERKNSTTSSQSDLPLPSGQTDGPFPSGDDTRGGIRFRNGDRFVTTGHGWELITANGERVQKGMADPNSADDATRIPLSNGATLISGGWGTDTISYPDGESISFSKNGTVKSVNGQPMLR